MMSECICEWPDGCGGTGALDCEGCGGDICVCKCGGYLPCGGCDECPGDDYEESELDGFYKHGGE